MLKVRIYYKEEVQGLVFEGVPMDKDGRELEHLAARATVNPSLLYLFTSYPLGMEMKEKVREFIEKKMAGRLTPEEVKHYPLSRESYAEPDRYGQIPFPPVTVGGRTQSLVMGGSPWMGQSIVKLRLYHEELIGDWVMEGIPVGLDGKKIHHLASLIKIDTNARAIFVPYLPEEEKKKRISEYLKKRAAGKLTRQEARDYPLPREFLAKPDRRGEIPFDLVTRQDRTHAIPVLGSEKWAGYAMVKVRLKQEEAIDEWVLEGVPLDEDGNEIPRRAAVARIDIPSHKIFREYGKPAQIPIRQAVQKTTGFVEASL